MSKEDYSICPTCGLPVRIVGGILDPLHNCIEALKLEVFRLREKVADIWG